jgi:cell division inhibitor SepF
MASAGLFHKVARWFGGYEEDEEEMELVDEPTPHAPNAPRSQKPRRSPLVLHQRDEGTMAIRHPRSLDDRMVVGLDLKQRRTVTLDLTHLSDADARYFFEFICGVVFALDAMVETVTDNIYLLVPRGVAVHNDEEKPEPVLTSRPTTRTAAPRAAAGGDGQTDLFWHSG